MDSLGEILRLRVNGIVWDFPVTEMLLLPRGDTRFGVIGLRDELPTSVIKSLGIEIIRRREQI